MIVVKCWVTVKRNVKVGEVTRRKVTYKWKGYFLFGIIPLYVMNYETLYTE